MSTRVGMVSLGCPKNQVDAEHMLFDLKKEGYELVSDAALADVVIVNTCGFIESAKQEAIDTILEFCTLKQEGRIKHVIATGCLAERYRDEMKKEIPELDAVVGLGSNGNIADIIRDIYRTEESICAYGSKTDLPMEGGRLISTEPFFAYIKIAEGCSNCCTYCAIPAIRGKFRSRKMEDILEEAKWLAEHGVTELVVIAQDTTRYGEDLYGKSMLPELLKKLCEIDGFKWIRTLYSYPERISDEFIDVLASEEKLVKYIDMPIQHCNAEILKRMNRVGSEAYLLELIQKLRARIPDIVLRTTLIAGFPGETEAQFEELCEFVKNVGFERLGCFAYSPEEGTKAYSMPDQVDEQTRNRRADIIMQEQMLVADRYNQAQLGKTVEIVCEGFDRYAECYFGRGAADAPDIDGKVFFTSEKKVAVGQYVKVELFDTLDYDLLGTVTE
ncbi:MULTISPECIES: 30S ribosomal protein S12 methylthiotransferase RimO [Ruminococcus]|uniref:Ribosomal protein uS12 methylthiotransferase RimO n=1 Tax=Ruminococcus albus (strain ATCC 27210 / DSM 20455 / JCM 14654 / NCDO 2250 / 7) TaxID=697329 RepID=E6UC72_RUMA7|nr:MULTISPECIES: 30S ribosomal protein S12 methylthiotransferase RimO [Ruminococcus]ADU22694.1 MiaB-like tRNA modifying enzyme YliG [Ruminococcus albus 7 = DSM 20455]MCR5019747.1 30S ribosomal protein S12 methylthiotransferase RimO [Ruminococcus sp.]